MASVHKLGRKEHWCAAITLPDGRRTFWSTSLPREEAFKRDALKVAQFWESLSKLARRGSLTPDRANRDAKSLLESIFGDLDGAGAKDARRARALPILRGSVVASIDEGKEEMLRLAGFEREDAPRDVEGFLKYWTEHGASQGNESTLSRYASIITRFKESIGSKVGRHLSLLTPVDITTFRDRAARELSVSTANHALKVVRMILREAVRLQMIPSNPAEAVRTLKRNTEETHRRNIMPEELATLLAAAKGEMRGLIIVSYLSGGMRLGDAALLRWSSVDFAKKTITIKARKTGANETNELHPQLEKYLRKLRSRSDPKGYVFPESADTVNRTGGRVSTLSNRFSALLAKAGLVDKQRHDVSKGKGRSGKRVVSELSFHSIRHAAATDLREAGVADSIAAAVVGHKSPAVGQKYVHVGEEAKRGAILKLDLPKVKKHKK